MSDEKKKWKTKQVLAIEHSRKTEKNGGKQATRTNFKKTRNYRSVHIFAINEWIKHGNTLKIKNEDRLNEMQEKAAIGRTRMQAQKQN